MHRNTPLLAGMLLLSAAAVGWSAPAKNAPISAKPGKRYSAPVALTAASAGRISPEDAVSVNVLLIGSKQADGSNPPAVQQEGPAAYVAMHAEFKDAAACQAACDALPAKGATPYSRFDRWADFWVKTDDASRSAVLASPGLVWVDIGRRLNVPPPPAPQVAAVRSSSEDIVRGGISGLTGKGVIVAVIDSGIDFRHPDFLTKDASGKTVTRVKYLWDTLTPWEPGKPGRKAPISYPNGTSVGTVYTQEDLNADLQAGSGRIPFQDTNGHGTSCAGIAAGNGAADRRYTGVAPDADIIGVRIGPGPSLPNADLVTAACDWLESVAGTQPMVINCSFGGQYAGRDGNRVQERQLNARFSPDRKGRALCIAAGNEGASRLHGETTFSSTPGVLTWNVPTTATGGSLELYFDSAETNITVTVPAGAKLDPKTGRGHVNQLTRKLVWSIDLPAGPGELRLTSTTGTNRSVDAYIKSWGGKESAAFTGPCATFGKQVGTPGTVANAITVGSYDWNALFEASRGTLLLADQIKTSSEGKPVPITIGQLSTYSNPGYSRAEGVIKPEIVAPGQFHIAATPLQEIPGKLLHANGKYQAFNGTSAATPYTAGIVALMLQKKPDLSLGEIRNLLTGSASRDAITGNVPNQKWGYGKLNLEAVQKLISQIR